MTTGDAPRTGAERIWTERQRVVKAQRDAAAESWLLDHHDYDWHIGNATADEWEAAYRAIDNYPHAGDQ